MVNNEFCLEYMLDDEVISNSYIVFVKWGF